MPRLESRLKSRLRSRRRSRPRQWKPMGNGRFGCIRTVCCSTEWTVESQKWFYSVESTVNCSKTKEIGTTKTIRSTGHVHWMGSSEWVTDEFHWITSTEWVLPNKFHWMSWMVFSENFSPNNIHWIYPAIQTTVYCLCKRVLPTRF